MDFFKHYWLKIAAYLANNHKKSANCQILTASSEYKSVRTPQFIVYHQDRRKNSLILDKKISQELSPL